MGAEMRPGPTLAKIALVVAVSLVLPRPARAETCASFYNQYGRLITECEDRRQESIQQQQLNIQAQRLEMERQFLEQENERRNYAIQAEQAQLQQQAEAQERQRQVEIYQIQQDQMAACTSELSPRYPGQPQFVATMCRSRLGL